MPEAPTAIQLQNLNARWSELPEALANFLGPARTTSKHPTTTPHPPSPPRLYLPSQSVAIAQISSESIKTSAEAYSAGSAITNHGAGTNQRGEGQLAREQDSHTFAHQRAGTAARRAGGDEQRGVRGADFCERGASFPMSARHEKRACTHCMMDLAVSSSLLQTFWTACALQAGQFCVANSHCLRNRHAALWST